MKTLMVILLLVSQVFAADPTTEANTPPQRPAKKKLSNKDLMPDSKPKFQKSSEVQNIPKDVQPNEGPQPTYTCKLSTGATYDMASANEYESCKSQGGTVSATATTDLTKKKDPKLGR